MNAGGTTKAPLVLLARGANYLGLTQKRLPEVQNVRHQFDSGKP
jgi:hypothetical protein